MQIFGLITPLSTQRQQQQKTSSSSPSCWAIVVDQMKMGASDGQTHAQAFGGTSVSALEEQGAVDDDGCDDGGRVFELSCCRAVMVEAEAGLG